MVYQRQEGFRFVFSPPLPAAFSMKQAEEESVIEGECLILDLSLKGAKVAALTPFPEDKKKTTITFSFVINEGTQCKVRGKVSWGNRNIKDYHYGIKFEEGSYSSDLLLQEIKYYAKNNRNK